MSKVELDQGQYAQLEGGWCRLSPTLCNFECRRCSRSGRSCYGRRGCSSPGDVAKAFSTGADFVMLGGMLAGHESGGELVGKK